MGCDTSSVCATLGWVEMAAAAGDLLGSKYRLVQRIGAGGMGQVWLADHEALDREVAVKLIAPAEPSPVALRRFEREARLAGRLRSPHVAQLYDFGLHDGQPYLVMERLEGEDLHRRLERGPLSLEEVARLVDGVAMALAEAHEHGIIHRDIKPANVFFTRAGAREVVKVLDFGIAVSAGTAAALTGEGAIIGTPQYMSPEQSQGQPVDARSDLWSLAVVAYEALTGVQPFEGGNDWEALAAIAKRPVPPPSTLVAGLPEAVDEFFRRALRRQPSRRFPTALTFTTCFAAAARGDRLERVEASDTAPMQWPGDSGEGKPARDTDVVAIAESSRRSPAAAKRRRLGRSWTAAGLLAGMAVIALGVGLRREPAREAALGSGWAAAVATFRPPGAGGLTGDALRLPASEALPAEALPEATSEVRELQERPPRSAAPAWGKTTPPAMPSAREEEREGARETPLPAPSPQPDANEFGI
jgi:hypothetical protein